MKLSYPRKHIDIANLLHLKHKSYVALILRTTCLIIHQRFAYLLALWPGIFQRRVIYTAAIYDALHTRGLTYMQAVFQVCTFVDGTAMRTTRPDDNVMQSAVYSGYKAGHVGNAQVVVTPDGLIACVGDMMPGHANDVNLWNRAAWLYALRHAALGHLLQPIANSPVTYGDSIHALGLYAATDDQRTVPN
jgi:hypothetical protein